MLLLATGCAAKPDKVQVQGLSEDAETNDPYESTNRKLYRVSDAVDKAAIHPVANGYRRVTTSGFRDHLHNLLTNLGGPAQFTNDVLQGKPRKAGDSFMRLLINTTLGVGGVFDVASSWGYREHSTDFGLTLAVWGVPSGPYLFLPVLGPSDPRDGVAYGVNSLFSPLTWVSFGGSATLGYARFGVRAVDSRARLISETDTIQRTALDPYATFRSLYQQHREAEIQNAQHDLPATVPAWYAGRTPAVPAAYVPPSPAPKIAPPASLSP
jgi:phospholipid-binding lipoprotein MlaA